MFSSDPALPDPSLPAQPSVEFARAVLAHLQDSVLLMDGDGILRFTTPSYEALLGYAPGELIGRRTGERVHPDDRAALLEKIQKVWREKGHEANEHRLLAKDGCIRYVRSTGSYLADGAPWWPGPCLLATVHDVTQEREARQRLETSERFFRALIDNLQDGIIVLALDQRTLYVSPRYAALAGHSVDSFANQSPGDRIYAEDLPRAKASFTETVADPHQAKVTEYRLKRPDGGLQWVRSVSRFLPDGIPGKPQPCVLIVAHDVQPERQSEQELRRFERLALLGEMTAGLAHELRNPLMAVSATAELLRGSVNLNVEELSDVDTILVQARRLRELLDQTLSKHKVQKPHALSAENSLRVAAGLARRSFGPTADKVAQVVTIAAETPMAWGEPGPLQQVLLNLILNALQAMPQGGQLTLNAGPQDGGVLFSVIDDGPGVPAEALTNIFDPFFTTKSYGSGLGLSVSRRIVESHGGRLWAERLDRGMAFRAWVPGPPQA